MKREGNYGKSFNDRVLAAEVRTLTLEQCKKWLKKGKGSMYSMVLNNLSRNVLPRLNEVTGEDGGPLIIELPKTIATKNGINTSTRANSA